MQVAHGFTAVAGGDTDVPKVLVCRKKAGRKWVSVTVGPHGGIHGASSRF